MNILLNIIDKFEPKNFKKVDSYGIFTLYEDLIVLRGYGQNWDPKRIKNDCL